MSLNNDVKALKQHKDNIAKELAAKKATAEAKQKRLERAWFEKNLRELFHELFAKTKVTVDPDFQVASFVHDGFTYYLCYEHYHRHSHDPEWPDDDYDHWVLKKGSHWFNDKYVVINAWYTKDDPYQRILEGIINLK